MIFVILMIFMMNPMDLSGKSLILIKIIRKIIVQTFYD